MATVRTCLWFCRDAEAAVRFYVGLVPGSEIGHVQHSPSSWPGGVAGDVIVVDFTLAGQSFQALNGGTNAAYGVAASISVGCDGQAEIDRLWTALTSDGGEPLQCGWVRDRWGVPWQVFPEILPRLLANPDPAVAGRVFAAMTRMVKLDITALEQAAAG